MTSGSESSCMDCKSEEVRTRLVCRPGLNTILGLLSGVVALITRVPIGANGMGLHDVHREKYCGKCGSTNISTPYTPTGETYDDGSGCCSCMLFILVVLVALYIALSMGWI